VCRGKPFGKLAAFGSYRARPRSYRSTIAAMLSFREEVFSEGSG
jgi:hypothetical protein